MEHRFSVGPMEWRSTMDGEGIHVCTDLRRRSIRWSDIEGAGVGHLRPGALPADFPTMLLPGLNHAAAAGQETQQCRQVMIAYRPMGRGRKRLKTLAISPDGTGQAAFLSELRARLGSRWEADEVDYLALRKRLGFSDWWIMPAVALVWVLVCAILLAYWDLRLQYALWITLMGLAIGLFITLVKRWIRA